MFAWIPLGHCVGLFQNSNTVNVSISIHFFFVDLFSSHFSSAPVLFSPLPSSLYKTLVYVGCLWKYPISDQPLESHAPPFNLYNVKKISNKAIIIILFDHFILFLFLKLFSFSFTIIEALWGQECFLWYSLLQWYQHIALDLTHTGT